jgi:ParB-like chromosome segregation protein Spo0J
VVKEGLSVRATEQALKSPAEGLTPRSTVKRNPSLQSQEANIAALEERFRRALGTKVKLSLDAVGKGELRVSFFSSAELERLLEKIGA